MSPIHGNCCELVTVKSHGNQFRYQSKVTAILTDANNGEEIGRIEDVPQDEISFSHVKRGKYEVVVEWTDGKKHRMTIPVEV